jgi:uncharacterized protein (DUF1015 family)
MLRINPFKAVRPSSPQLAQKIALISYDVRNREEARQLAVGNALSFLHVVHPEVDLPDDTQPHSDIIYETARKNFHRLIEQGDLFQDDTPCVYLYRQTMQRQGQTYSQTGVVACCHVDDYNNNIIKKHEKTRQAKEDDRTRHVLTINANAGPVFLLHRDDQTITDLIAGHTSAEPLYDFTAVDGVRHTVWRVEDYQPFVQAFARIPSAYVADGHHRSASAARASAERARANPAHTGNEEYNWFLTVLFNASELNILPYHRVVKDLNGLTPDQLINRIAQIAHVTPDPDPEPRTMGCFGMYLAGAGGDPSGRWYSVCLPPGSIDQTDPIASLDCQLLYDRILHPILGVGDVRTDERIDFVAGVRGAGELAKLVDSGEAAVAFAMHPVAIPQLIAVSDAGAIMPPKSTWFEPKLCTGLLVHMLD